MGNTRFIVTIINQFKKDYGTDLRYITVNHSEFQTDTGIRTFIKTVYNFPAVLLPTTLTRKFIQDIGYLAANKNFTYGALNDYETTSFIVSGEDFPEGLKVDLDGYLIHDGIRLEKVQIITLEHRVGYLIVAKNVKGSLPYDIQSEVCQNEIQFRQMLRFELN